MSENKKLVPKRRFKEFENADAWEQRELGKFVSLITKGTTPRDKSGSGRINFIKVENISDGIISPVSKISEDEHEGYLQRSKLKENDILISIAGTLGRTGVVDKTILPANTNQALAIIRGYDFDKDFLLTSLNGKAVKDFIRRNPTIGAQPNLSLEQVGKFLIYTPKKEEQIQIGVFFKNLDQTIAFQQRKLEKMKSMKSAYLSEMFPAEGERKPKRRFPGFTDDWEQRECNDICSISTGKGNTQDREDGAEYPFYVRSPIIERSSKYLYDEEAVLTVGDGVGTGKVYHYIHGKYNLHQRVYRMFGFDKGVLGKYFYIYFSQNFYKRVHAMTAKTSVDSVRLDMIARMNISFPSIAEQRKISDFFFDLDQTIAFQQQKLEKLQNIKKAYLNEMFI